MRGEVFWSSRDILFIRSIWSISNGSTVRLWKDAWLVGPGSGKIISLNKGLADDITMDFLIDPITPSWRKELIADLLLPIDVDSVLNTPISISHVEDSLHWTTSLDGVFRFGMLIGFLSLVTSLRLVPQDLILVPKRFGVSTFLLRLVFFFGVLCVIFYPMV